MEKILSVVIPSYNVEKFLRQTLDSFVDERVLPSVEVLIVDDGSSDGTAAIGKEYEAKYPECFRLITKENGGHGSTINRGIAECTGKYFKVVDGDDWVNTEDFVSLVENLKQCDADFVVTNYYEVNHETGEKTPVEYEVLRELLRRKKNAEDFVGDGREEKVQKSGAEVQKPEEREKGCEENPLNFREIADKVMIGMHALVIRSEILKSHYICLDEHCFYVDVEYILFPVPYVETVAYFDLYVYMYRLAQATQSVSMRGYQKHIQNHIDVILHLAEFAEAYSRWKNRETKKADYINRRIAAMVGDQASIFMSYPVDNMEMKQKFLEFDAALKEKNPEIYSLSDTVSGTLRLLRKLRFRGYKMIMRLGQKRNHIEISKERSSI